MTIRKKQSKEIVLDLTGPDGNAFVLLAKAKSFAEQLGLNSKEVTDEMKSGNYENLVQVFDSYFGDYVVLER